LGFARWLAAEPNTGSQGALTIILSAIDGRFPEKPFLVFSTTPKAAAWRPDKFP
jgi:hypothetical protein